MSFVINLMLGLLFGIGLVVSGMSDPAKVLNFLDLFGSWDPSLAFVMGGAVITAFFGYRLVLKREKPVAAASFHLPANNAIDRRILIGSAIFCRATIKVEFLRQSRWDCAGGGRNGVRA